MKGLRAIDLERKLTDAIAKGKDSMIIELESSILQKEKKKEQ